LLNSQKRGRQTRRDNIKGKGLGKAIREKAKGGGKGGERRVFLGGGIDVL